MVRKINNSELDLYEYARDHQGKERMNYDVERDWIQSVENGTFHKKKVELTDENIDKLYRVGTLAKNNPRKQLEYMIITVICLASRAAIRGGMDPYEAYTLSDLYYQQTAECKTDQELLQMYIEVANDYSQRVAKVKEQRLHGSYVEQCKAYIASHRNKKYSVEEMASELGISRGYLSKLFSDQEGKTIQSYIMEQRLEAAANMLRYSDIEIGEISDYLQFNSQSYFGERFKKQYHLTPLNYRKPYQN